MIRAIADVWDDIVFTVAVSNTPPYMYRWLRHHVSRSLSNKEAHADIDEVVRELRKELKDSNDYDLSKASYIYALFVLLTIFEYHEVRVHIDWLRDVSFRWIRDMVEYYVHRFSTTIGPEVRIIGNVQGRPRHFISGRSVTNTKSTIIQ